MKRLLVLVLLGVLAAPAGSALAAGRSGLDIHAIFEAGRASGFAVGEPLDVAYHGGGLHVTRVCWRPAPVDRPACSAGFGAPRRAGVQRFAIRLSNGRTIHATRRIHRAARTIAPSLDAMRADQPPAPFHARRSCTVYGNGADGDLATPVGRVRRGDGVAAYYRGPGVVQVFVYRSLLAGFLADGCVRPGL